MFEAVAALQNVVAFTESFQQFTQHSLSVRLPAGNFFNRSRGLTKIIRQCREFEIYSDPDDRSGAGWRLNGLCQDAAELSIVHANVVRPLYIRFHRASMNQRVRHG